MVLGYVVFDPHSKQNLWVDSLHSTSYTPSKPHIVAPAPAEHTSLNYNASCDCTLRCRLSLYILQYNIYIYTVCMYNIAVWYGYVWMCIE